MKSAGFRNQRSINRPATVAGTGFFTGHDVTLTFVPAPENHGIVFERTDLADAPRIPARLEYVTTGHRRTTLQRSDARVDMVEHVLSALAGLRIDNCLVRLNATELPGLDGSCREFCECLLEAGIVEQSLGARRLDLNRDIRVSHHSGHAEIHARALVHRLTAVTYHLDYGSRSLIPPQTLTAEITPESFVREIAFARTFILESEIRELRARGYGSRTTAADLLVVGTNGVIDNRLHVPDEFVRHKILDCIGDLALLGCDIFGHVNAWRSGHELNRSLARRIRDTHTPAAAETRRVVA